LWIGRLKIINERLAKVDKVYKKNDYNLISHIFANLPQKLYMDVVTTLRVMGLQKYELKKVSNELKEKWKRDIKSNDKDFDNKALNVNEHKKPYTKKKWNSKQFKGTCRSCGKMGHKSSDCYSKGKDNKEDNKGKKNDFSDRKCYRCQKMGHMAYQCPEKDKETGLVIFMARDEDEEVAAGMLMSLDETVHPDDGDSNAAAGPQVNLTRTEAIREEHHRYQEKERYQRVAAAVAARKEEERMKNCGFGYGCSPGLCGCSCKTMADNIVVCP
jgi:hypothetical protein